MATIRKLNNNVNIVGKNIKKYRELQKLSQPDLCKKNGFIRCNNVYCRHL